MTDTAGAQRRTAACAASEHAACPHRMSGVIVRVRGDQPEPAVALCLCPCHDRCAVAARDLLSLADWAQACTCPGSPAGKEEARRLLRDHAPSLADRRRDAERDAAERQEARRAARERGAAPGPPGSARQAVRALAEAGRLLRGGIRLLRNVQRVQGPDGSAAYFAPPDHTWPAAQVILYPQAQAILQAARDRRTGPDDQFLVWLERRAAESPDPPVLSVRVEGGQIGELSPDDSRSYGYALNIAEGRGETLTVLARRDEDREGELSVVISPAGTAWWSR